MHIQATKPLFAWDSLEDSPTFKTIQQLLKVIPDQALLDSLRVARGKGRDDVPVRVAWGVLVLSVALRHPTIEACLGELRRNESLRKLIGIESEEAVPQKWNLSRFLDRMGQEPHLAQLHGIFDAMIQRLGSVVPDLGRHTAGDATSLNARRNLTGSRRFFALLGVILVVHAAFATLLAMAPRWEGTLGQTKLSPIAKALYGKVKPPAAPRRRKAASQGRERQTRLRLVG